MGGWEGERERDKLEKGGKVLEWFNHNHLSWIIRDGGNKRERERAREYK